MTFKFNQIIFQLIRSFQNLCEFRINPLLICEAVSNLVQKFMEKKKRIHKASSVKFCVAQGCLYPPKYEDGKLKVCVMPFNLVSSFDRSLPCGFPFINNLSSISKSAILFSLILLSNVRKPHSNFVID